MSYTAELKMLLSESNNKTNIHFSIIKLQENINTQIKDSLKKVGYMSQYSKVGYMSQYSLVPTDLINIIDKTIQYHIDRGDIAPHFEKDLKAFIASIIEIKID